jgi:hypothetical protein
MKLLIITGILTAFFVLLVTLSSMTSAQEPTTWTNYNTSNQCGVSFSYPGDWILSEEISRNRFDTSDNSIVSVRSANEIPKFSLIACDKWQLNESESNNVTESVSLLFLIYMGKQYREAVKDLRDVEIIESTHTLPNSISNNTKEAVVLTLKKGEAGVEYYSVLHNGVVYTFSNVDLANDFDSPESKQIRDRILQSIKFLN